MGSLPPDIDSVMGNHHPDKMLLFRYPIQTKNIYIIIEVLKCMKNISTRHYKKSFNKDTQLSNKIKYLPLIEYLTEHNLDQQLSHRMNVC